MGNPGSAFEDLDRELANRGFEATEEVFHPQAFGSRYSTYKRGNTFIRLIWDGKDDCLVLETRDEPEPVWKDLWIERIGRASARAQNIDALRTALSAQIDAKD